MNYDNFHDKLMEGYYDWLLAHGFPQEAERQKKLYEIERVERMANERGEE